MQWKVIGFLLEVGPQISSGFWEFQYISYIFPKTLILYKNSTGGDIDMTFGQLTKNNKYIRIEKKKLKFLLFLLFFFCFFC